MLYKTLGKIKLDNADLINYSTPKFTVERKIKYFNKAREAKKKSLNGSVTVTRCTPNNKDIDSFVFTKTATVFKDEPGFYNYEKDQSNSERCVWWINFADPKLFGYYGGQLFAQDEIQVFEHPVLGSIRNYLIDPGEEHMRPNTLVLRDGAPVRPTPYLIENAPMWLKVDTNPRLPMGGMGNIYGRNFMTVPEEEIEAGVHVVKDDVKNNIMAVSAIVGEGQYSYDEIELLLKTLVCAFSNAKEISAKMHKKCVIHGGNWGCGAFGGNPELMYFLQICAAGITGVDELVLHSVDDDTYLDAKEMYEDLDDETSLDSIINMLFEKEYYWGFGDGN